MKCLCNRKLKELRFTSNSGVLLHVGLECETCKTIAVAAPASKEDGGGLYSLAELRFRRKYGENS